MPRVARPWFRFYVEAMADPKIRTLSPAHRWLWVAVLGLARQSPNPGFLLVSDDLPHTAESIADFAGLPKREAALGLQEFEQRGMVERVPVDSRDPLWVVVAFLERQYESAKTVLEPSLELDTNGVGNPQSHRQNKKRVSASPPRDFVPTSEHDSFAREQGLDLGAEVAHWLDWCEANGRTYKSINAGFSTWLRQAVQFGRGGKSKPATLEELATPAPKPEPRSCPLELCGGSGYVDAPGKKNTVVPCRCRTMAAAG